jgi:hypothetical protein
MTSVINGELNQAVRSSNYQKKQSSRLDQIDFRDRFVIIDLPYFKDGEVDLKNLERWLGELSL